MNDQQQHPCLPCFTDNHDWCTRQTNLAGLDPRCDCQHPDDQPANQGAGHGHGLDAVIDERAAARTQKYAAKQTRRQAERKQMQTARTHGLHARHNRKLTRKATP